MAKSKKNPIREKDFLEVTNALDHSEEKALELLYKLFMEKELNRPQLRRFVQMFVDHRLDSQLIQILESMDE